MNVLLKAHLSHLHILRADNQAEAEQLIGDAHILMAEPARANRCWPRPTQLSWLQSLHAGVDAARWTPVAATTTALAMSRGSSAASGEYVFDRLLSPDRQLPLYSRQRASGRTIPIGA